MSLKSLSDLPQFDIRKVQFKVLSSDEIRKRSVCEIVSKRSEGENSVNDPRLGPNDEKTSCITCKRSFHECSGHEGHIELPMPVINPELRGVVLSILSCICSHCSSLLVDKSVFEGTSFSSKKGVDRLNIIKKYLENGGKCFRKLEPGESPCLPSPIYRKNDNNDGGHMIKYIYKKGKGSGEQITNYRTSQEIYDILDNISDENAAFLGFNPKCSHPRDFMMKNLLVSPICTRPYLYQDGEKLLDFMTNMYTTILSIKEKLRDTGLSENAKKDCEKKINNAICSMISVTGEVNMAKGGSSKSVRQKLGGKKGIVREKAMGKRIDFAGRCVIGGESTLPFGYILIPKFLASTLTKEIIVTNYNLAYVRRLYDDGLVQYIRQSGGRASGQSMMILPNNKEKLVPRVGDTVDVSLVNGDVVTFNRQPTLHKPGMMSQRAIIHDNNNIRIHSSTTEATNADFDGDDANIYVPQRDETILESILLGGVPGCISNPGNSGVTLSLYYNACLGMYLLSDDKILLDEEDWETGLEIFKRDLRKNKPKEVRDNRLFTIKKRLEGSGIHKLSGKALISCMFPSDMYFNQSGILVIDGILIRGRLEKSNYKLLVKYVHDTYGQYFATNFIGESQWLYDWYLTIRGFSSSMHDILPPDPRRVEENVAIQLLRAQKAVNELEASEENFWVKESKILSELARIDDSCKKMIDATLSPDNSYIAMAKSGANGSTNNVKCMMAMYGQELNNGIRPKYSISNNSRVTFFDDFNDNSVTSRGYITTSFLTGLDPQPLVLHLDGSRDGLTASILVTPDSGNLNRKMNNFLNSTRIGSSGEVELTRGNVIQFAFNDGLDDTKLTNNYSLRRGKEKYFIDLQNCADRLMSKAAARRKRV